MKQESAKWASYMKHAQRGVCRPCPQNHGTRQGLSTRGGAARLGSVIHFGASRRHLDAAFTGEGWGCVE